MASGIYSITAPSGKRYIGSAKNFAHRWGRHRRELKAGIHHCEALQRAHDKYGADALIYSILECCEPAELIIREQAHFDGADWAQLYNTARVAGSNLGVRHTVEAREKMSEARQGIVYSAETRAKMSASQRLRAPVGPETRAKRAAANQGRVRSAETRAKMSTGNLNPGAETRAKMSAARIATAARKRHETGLVKGVYARRSGNWVARVDDGGERRHVGTYGTQTLAHAMRLLYLEAWPYREIS
jgi:group I intron endonuclease